MGRSWRTFLQVQELLLGMGTSQRDLPRRRFALAHTAQDDEVEGWLNFHRCLHMAATFHSASFLIPSPPSLTGCVRSSQATFAPPDSSCGPFQKKHLKICSIFQITFFGRINRPFQKDWILQRTDFMSWSRPAKDRKFAVRLVTLEVMQSTNGLQCEALSFVDCSGTPR